MSESADYEVEIEVKGARFPVFGYAQVQGKSTREALDEAVRLIEQRVGVAWRDTQDNRVQWEDFAQPDMEIEIAGISPYGSKWELRRHAEAASANRATNE
jgi:hypothetical protein